MINLLTINYGTIDHSIKCPEWSLEQLNKINVKILIEAFMKFSCLIKVLPI